MAVRLVVLLLKCSFIKLSEAESAYKVLRVELLEHSCDATTGYWFVAAGTEGATFSVVVSLAVRVAFVLEERSTVERFTTIL